MVFKLGKKSKRVDARTFKLSRYFLGNLPPVPAAVDWSGKVPSWGMMLNDSIGDCTCAGAGHAEMCWTSNAGTEFIPADAQILNAYEAIGGYNPGDPSTDQGCDMLSALNFWRNSGIAGRTITAYAEVDPKNRQQVMASVAFFGGLYIGVNLPQSAMDATNSNQVWSNTTDTNILGGHCVLIVAYNSSGPVCVTWGQLQQMTWDWFQTYCDEAYCPMSPDWIGLSGTAPSGFNLPQLSQDLQAL